MATASPSTQFFDILKWKSDKNAPPPRLVIAIDIGTFSSGYTLQQRSEYKTDPRSPHISKFSTNNLCTHKNSTALLLRPDKSFQAFGYEAESQFDSLESDGEDPTAWYFFRHFKMMLYHQKAVCEETPVEAAHGKNLPVIEVFSSTIRYMKDHALDYLAQNNGGAAIAEADVKWVITVPAIWDDTVKRVMRMSAEKAGIPGEQLCIAIEPECAALYCSQIPLTELLPERAQGQGQAGFAKIAGFTVMIVDMGGGTVDFTTLRMLKGGTMEYVFESGGGPWGGTNVNEKFKQLLLDVMGADVIKEFSDNHSEDAHKLQMEFELQKRKLKPPSEEGANVSFKITLPTSLKDLCEKQSGKTVSDILKSRPEPDDILYTRNNLVFNPNVIRKFIQQTVVEITKYVKHTLNHSKCPGEKIDLLLLVGGFAESSLVVKSIREDITSMQSLRIPVVRPKDPELAVLKGAVLYGHNEQAIVSRKLRYTYGIGMVMEFDDAKHDVSKKFEADGKVWASDVFRKHATVGQAVQIGQWTLTKEYHPVDRQQHSVQVYVFASERKYPVHTTEPDCKCIGKVDIPLSNNGDRQSRKAKVIAVSMNFGGTEVEVKVTDKTTTKCLIVC